MNQEQTREIEAFKRMKNFGAENAAQIAANLPAKTAMAAIGDGLAMLDLQGVDRISAETTKLGKTKQRGTLRRELYEDLGKVSEIARLLAKTNPAYENKFRASLGSRTDINLVENARSVVRDALPLKIDFTNYGLDANFFAEMDEKVSDFEATISGQDSSNRAKINAVASIEDILDEMFDAKDTLDVTIPIIFAAAAGKIAEWTAASHVERPPRRTKKPNS